MDRLLPWLRGSGWVYALLAIGLALIAWRVSAGGDTRPADEGVPVVASEDGIADADDAGAAPGVIVHVAGSVRRPGVYELGGRRRVRDALRRAGGPAGGADLSAINLAAPLQDGQQVVIPRKGSAATGQVADGSGNGPVSLSSAGVEDLERLDGIGPALAARIVEHRSRIGGFASIEQLDDVPGIGPARLESLREKVVP